MYFLFQHRDGEQGNGTIAGAANKETRVGDQASTFDRDARYTNVSSVQVTKKSAALH